MPYMDPEKYHEYQARYRQEHLFEAETYRREHRDAQRGYEETYRGLQRQSYDGKRGRSFAGFDGEGHGEGSEHAYYLLRAAGVELRTGEPLTTEECLNLIADLPAKRIHCVYYGTYDCTMILRGLPKDVVGSLLNRQSRAFQDKRGRTVYAWVRWNGFRLDYIPGKRLCVGREDGPTVTIHDVGGFFQEAFIRRLESGKPDGAVVKWNDDYDIASREEIDILCAGKAGRGDWSALSEDTRYYNEVECAVLERLMAKLNDATRAVGLDASPFEGAGNLAASMLNNYVAKPHRARGESPYPPRPPENVPVMGAYYGGRFEISAHGPVRVPVIEYDIASAYPAAMLDLPCLWHGRWEHGDYSADQSCAVRLGYIRWTPTTRMRRYFGPCPVRLKNGSVVYPLAGQGWYWDVEWPDAGYDVVVHDCWSYLQECACQPFEWIRGVYEGRKRMGKSGKGYILKLALNSLYGKAAQSVGAAPWANHVYAGLITAMTRNKLYRLMSQSPESVIMMATDAVYSLKSLEVDISSELGGWEQQDYHDLHIVQPGIYFDSDGAKVKTRGVARRTLVEYRQEIIEAFNAIDTVAFDDPGLAEKWGCYVDYDGLVTLRLAYSQNRLEKAGYFGKLRRRISYYPEPKRQISTLHRDVHGTWRTYAPTAVTEPSRPYREVYIPDHTDEEMIDAAPEELKATQCSLF